MFHLDHILAFLMLLGTANGSPILMKKLFGDRFAAPVDAGICLPDGHRLFGASKTVRGIFAAALLTPIVSVAVGWPWQLGLFVAVVSMAGDLLSSFLKRRLGRPPSSRATGLDQIPEALLPALACANQAELSAADIATIVLIFFGAEIVLSKWLFRIGFRDRPH
jgi:CDP-archaeol synthase